jgi:hypothetical protein
MSVQKNLCQFVLYLVNCINLCQFGEGFHTISFFAIDEFHLFPKKQKKQNLILLFTEHIPNLLVLFRANSSFITRHSICTIMVIIPKLSSSIQPCRSEEQEA